MAPSLLLSIHLFACAFWFGVLGVEFILEQGRTRSRDHGYAVADIHYNVDLYLEAPAFITVLITGLMMSNGHPLTGLYLVKVCAGLTAILGNVGCIYAIVRRKWAARVNDFNGLVKYSYMVDKLSAMAVPAGFTALFIGFHLAH